MPQIFIKDLYYRRTRAVMTTVGIVVLITLILLLGGIMNGMKMMELELII